MHTKYEAVTELILTADFWEPDMSKFVKAWLNAAATSASAFAGMPYAPVELRAENDDAPEQLALPLDGPDHRSRVRSEATQQAKAA